ncbi:unnamed protein product [Parajaminaea phylloscopi]
MLRRQSRERREYLYRKSLEAQEAQTYARKQKVRQLLAEGKPVPKELREGAGSDEKLARGLDLDAGQTDPLTSFDSEYASAGAKDPRILITTSRSPSSRLTAFAKEMRLVFPNSTRINRGGYKVHDLAAAARANNISDVVVFHEHRGVPDAMVVSHFPHGPTALFTLHNVVLRHEVAAHSTSTVSEQYPHLIFEGFESKLGGRIRDILKYLFPAPKEESKRVMTFRNERDFLSFRHHVFLKTSHKEVSLAEVGPRFEMRPYEIRQGTLEMGDSADVEWVLRPYMRTSGKKDQL